MNREQKRKQAKTIRSKKKKYSLEDVQAALSIAIEMKKHTKGHLFSKAQSEHCVFCGQTMKTKEVCQYWVLTMVDRMQTALINPNFFTDQNIEALWLQHGEGYQNIKLPLNVGTSEKKN